MRQKDGGAFPPMYIEGFWMRRPKKFYKRNSRSGGRSSAKIQHDGALFMLPAATPPNAIVFGSGAVKVQDMLKAGAVLDILGILAIVTLITILGPVVFG